MGSKEILAKVKEIQEEYQASVNITTGQLTGAHAVYELKLKEIQAECNHMWDTGEYAIQKVNGISICPICRKKSKN